MISRAFRKRTHCRATNKPAAGRAGRSVHGLGGFFLTTTLVASLGAQDLKGAVQIGNSSVASDRVAHALAECEHHAPKLSPESCIDRYWVPRWLLDAEAESRKLNASDGAHLQRASFMHARLVEKIAEEQPEPTEAQVAAFIKKHRRDFDQPLRIRIFRILVSSSKEASEIIRQMGPSTTLGEFRDLARKNSKDRATNERAGDLGFVWPDGTTDVPQVSAETSLYEAALKLQDGEFSAEPVPEGKRFAVIWRRGSLPARTPDETSQRLAKARINERKTEEAVSLILQKAQSKVKNRDSILLGKLRRKDALLFKEP